MWTMFRAIGLTMTFDYGLGFLVGYNKKKQQERDDDLFLFKLEQILKDESKILKERIEIAQELIRDTAGATASGSYIALDNIKQTLKYKMKNKNKILNFSLIQEEGIYLKLAKLNNLSTQEQQLKLLKKSLKLTDKERKQLEMMIINNIYPEQIYYKVRNIKGVTKINDIDIEFDFNS